MLKITKTENGYMIEFEDGSMKEVYTDENLIFNIKSYLG